MQRENRRRKKGEIKALILKARDKGRPLRFTEIRNYLEKETGSRVADQVVARNIQKLRSDGELYQININGVDMWTRPPSYSGMQTRKAIKEIAGDELPIAFGHPDLAPSFMLASNSSPEEFEMGIESQKTLDDLASGHLASSVHSIIFEMSGKGRVTILGFAARCLWLGFLTSRIREETMKEENPKRKSRDTLENLIRTKIVEFEYGNETLASYMLEGMELALGDDKQRGEGEIACGVEIRAIPLPAHMARIFGLALVDILAGGVISPKDKFDIRIREFTEWADNSGIFNIPQSDEIGKKLKKLSDELKLVSEQATKRWEEKIKEGLEGTEEMSLEEWEKEGRKVELRPGEFRGYMVSMDAVAHEVIKTVPNDAKENVRWLKAHKRELLDFLKEVQKIRFAYIVAAGYPNLERWPMELLIPKRVDDFLEALEETWERKWSGRTIEIVALLEYVEKTIQRMEKKPNLKLADIEDGLTDRAFRYAFGLRGRPQVLYKYDPRTRRLEWWRKFKEALEKALKTCTKEEVENAKKFFAKHALDWATSYKVRVSGREPSQRGH